MVIGITIELTAAGGQQLSSRQFTWPSRFVRHAIAFSLSVNLGKSLGRIAVFEDRAGLQFEHVSRLPISNSNIHRFGK